ncbi:MAG: Na+/H+ antiporter NhaC family protein [Eubacterium sp.]
MAKGVGDKNIITMILIFMTAGVFVGTVERSSAESVAYFVLSVIPAQYAVVVLFVVSAFVSLAMGTSVGTITLITPIAVAISANTGFDLPLCIGSVMGGAMFGDNLSFISDTTIAACNGQGCEMQDKFRQNFRIALPAAILTVIIILIKCAGQNVSKYFRLAVPPHPDYSLSSGSGRRYHRNQCFCCTDCRNCIWFHYYGCLRRCACHRTDRKYGQRRFRNV